MPRTDGSVSEMRRLQSPARLQQRTKVKMVFEKAEKLIELYACSSLEIARKMMDEMDRK